MSWKTIAAAVILTPVAALFLGVGVLSFNVSQTWDSRNTDALISGLVASCSMGGIAVAGLLCAIIGIPFAMRLMDRWREADRYAAPPARMLPAARPWQEGGPPLLTAKPEVGTWQTGPAGYDLWSEEEPVEVRSRPGW